VVIFISIFYVEHFKMYEALILAYVVLGLTHMCEYDYKSYEKCLEKILESAQKDYWTEYVDINKHQVSVGKTYLWVSVALITTYTASFKIFIPVLIKPFPLTIFILSSFLAIIAFGICLYAIPVRKGYYKVYLKGWGEYSQNAHELLSKKGENLYISFLTNFINQFDIADFHNHQANAQRATLLRLTSWVLIISFALSMINLSAIMLHYSGDFKKECFMIESDNNQSGNTSSNQPTTSEAPHVPTPPAPPGTTSQTIITHGENTPPETRVFITDHKTIKK
jgi:hypothetical protein